MQNLSRSQLKLVEELITIVTGFSPHEENFKLCHQFSISNVRFHRYLDTDSFQLNQRINGLVEKFNIHSEISRARDLRSLVDDFLMTPLSEKGYPSTQSHFDLLSFILEMHESPLYNSYEDTIPEQINTNALEMDSKEDWHALLMDDMNDMIRDDYNDASDFEYEEDYEDYGDQTDSHKPTVVIELQDDVPRPPSESFQKKVDLPVLNNKIQPEYWQSNDVYVNVTNFQACAIRVDWESYMSRINPEQAMTLQRMLLSEYQIMREVLWMFLGAKESFLFKCQSNPLLATKNCYQMAQLVAVPHLTNGALDEYLQQFIKWGSMLQCIRSVCAYVSTANLRGAAISQTVATFSGQLSCFQHVFYDVVHNIEKKVRGQETQTLMTMFTDLQPWFRRISTVRDIILGATAGRFEALIWDTTVISLLDHIYDVQCSLAITGFDPWMFTWIKVLFVRTFEPYLHSLDVMLSGQTCLVWDNLFLTKKSDIKPRDVNYWNDGYSLKYSENGKMLAAVPQVLHTFVRKLVVTIKSMDLLKEIAAESKLPDVVKNVIIEPGSFTNRLELAFLSTSECDQVDHRSTIVVPKDDFSSFLTGNYPLTEIDDKLYMTVFRDLFVSMYKVKLQAETGSTSVKDNGISSIARNPLSTPQALIQVKFSKILEELISERHQSITTKLLSVLLDSDKLRLGETLSTLRAVYLMESGDTMYDFTWDIFQRMRNREDWWDSLVLNLRLRECLLEKFDDSAKQFWIVVESKPGVKDVDFFSLECFTEVKLNYVVSWPLYFVINEECLAKYNRVFQFLLQVKYVKFRLDQLSFSHWSSNTTTSKSSPFNVSRLFLFRHKMLHIVNSLHQFTLTRIHSILLDLNSALASSVNDLCDLISVHTRFVAAVHRACLLDDSTSQLRQAVITLVSLGVTLADLWEGDGGKTTTAALHRAEEKLNQYVDFLTGLFTEAVKRESLAHLEPLAEAFRSFPRG